MRDMREVGRALRGMTGAIKTNPEIHGDTVPYPRFLPRYAGDRSWGRSIDPREEPLFPGPEGFEDFVAGLRGTLAEEP